MDGLSLLSKLGEGACGSVFLVERGGERYALKRVAVSKLSTNERKAILREVHLLSRLRHDNIIGYHDAFPDGGDMCILMAVAEGGTLDGRIRRAKDSGQPLDQAWILDCIVQLCSCVHYLHSCRILHRDIKPTNILLTADGTPQLADFGISIPMISDERQLGRVLRGGSAEEDRAPDVLRSNTLEGTPLYLAPELFSPALEVVNTQYSTASDVWALGVCFYEMVALHRPYEGQSLYSLAYKLCRDLGQNAMSDWLAEKEAERTAGMGGERGGQAAQFDLGSFSNLGYDRHMVLVIEGMLHKRPRQRATLSEILGREAISRWIVTRRLPLGRPPTELEGGDDRSPLPDVMQWGRGARLPRIRDDLAGVIVTAVACGGLHAAAVSESGEIYTWGKSPHGQLGHGDRATLSSRRRVLGMAPHRVAAVACGRSHTLALTSNGALYAWGSNEFGQLGLSELPPGGLDAMRCALAPIPLAGPPGEEGGWRAVAAGEAHSAAVSSAGGLFTWGTSDDSRLGLQCGAGDAASFAAEPSVEDGIRVGDIVASPRRVDGLPALAVSPGCGDAFTAVLCADGRLYGFGANWAGQLGLDDAVDEFLEPTLLLPETGNRIIKCACGAEHMAAANECGELWVWGGRFGPPSLVSPPLRQRELEMGLHDGTVARDSWEVVACGSECIIATTVHGECYAWGDGAHGRLGLGDDSDHDSPQLVAQLSVSHRQGCDDNAEGSDACEPRNHPIPATAKILACGSGVSSGSDEGPLMLAVVMPLHPDECSERVRQGSARGSFRSEPGVSSVNALEPVP